MGLARNGRAAAEAARNAINAKRPSGERREKSTVQRAPRSATCIDSSMVSVEGVKESVVGMLRSVQAALWTEVSSAREQALLPCALSAPPCSAASEV